MKSLFSFGNPVELIIEYTGDIKKHNDIIIYQPQDNISGVLKINGKKIDHCGIKVELLGTIETSNDKGNIFEFTSSIRILSQSGTLDGFQEFPFAFVNVDKPHESYIGKSVKLRYFIRATISRNYATNIVKEEDFSVQLIDIPPEINSTIKMEVGIEECLHIEFEYNKSKYHLKDVVIGKIYFLLVRIKIKHMELAIVRRETSGSGSEKLTESETVVKFEIMDGAPVKGESIPVRLYLGGIPLTPTYKNVNNKFSVKYFLNLVLVDEEDRRYFKQQEIVLWRKSL